MFLVFFSASQKTSSMAIYTSYNDSDIMKKLGILKVPLDPSTGEAKYLRELNLLGRKKFNNEDKCAKSKKSSKSKRNNIQSYSDVRNNVY